MLFSNFALIMAAFRLWGKTGLVAWTAISCIIANIQVTKNIILFGFEATLGNCVYATAFLATDIISEWYGRQDAKKAVWMGLFSMLSMTVLMQLAILFVPSPSDMMNPSLINLFSFMPRIATASIVAYLISNLHDVWSFNFWKTKTHGKHLWLRNNASTMVSQLIDSVIFTLGAFYGVYHGRVLVEIILTTYLLKWLVAVFDTGMIYLAGRWVRQGKIKDLPSEG